MRSLRSTSSYWYDTSPTPDHPKLEADERADAVVVGAGIAGLTAAYHLAKAGVDVAVLDRWGVAMGETASTTAHVAYVVDTPLQKLARLHGEDGAKAAWDSSAHAIELVEQAVAAEGIDCELTRLDGILYGPREDDPNHLNGELDLARRMGYEAERVDPDDVPFPARAALRYPDNAKFRPREYLLGLAEAVEDAGGRVYGSTHVDHVHGDTGNGGVKVEVRGGHTVRGDHAIVATNVPLHAGAAMYTRYYPYRSYVIAARVPAGEVPDALYWDTLTPYHYTRVEPGEERDLVILGGEDHKVGHDRHPEDAFVRLETYLREAVKTDVEVEWHWSGQVNESMDGLPYIGPSPGRSDNVLIATAFTGDGMTFGTLAGWMLAERVLGRETPWDELYDPGRVRLGGAATYVRENVSYPLGVAERFLGRGRQPDVASIPRGEGAVISLNGKKVAVHRTEEGELQAVSAVCTHKGCEVAWNGAEQSWDCPCHGSRFSPTGELLHGPAHTGLEKAEAPEAPERPQERQL